MAGIRLRLGVEAAVPLSAATAKTVLQLVAPANQRLIVKGVAVSFDKASAGQPGLVEILRQTTAGTMTAETPRKLGNEGETVQSSGQSNASAEPTAGDILKELYVHPQTGYERVFDPEDHIEVPGGGRLGIRCTFPDAVNCRPEFIYEE